ncbi:MAG: GNAT family N-acetyltransferase [Bacteroidota bacterium]
MNAANPHISANKTAYRLFCQQQQAHLPLWIYDWYLDACCQEGQWDVALVEEKGRVVAALPYFIKEKWGFRYITMPMFVKNMGPYVIPDKRALKHTHKYYAQLIEQLPQMASFKQNFYVTCSNWLPFYWKNYQQTTYYTYQFDDLSDLSKIETQFNRSVRRKLRKASAQLELKFDLLTPAAFYEINTLSFQRQGKKTPYSLAQFLTLDAALAKHHARQFFYAQDATGKIHSAAYLVWDSHTAYYLLSGDVPELRKSGSGFFLIWKAIQYTKNVLGLNTFDFEGSIIQRLETIRVHFGAKQVPYFYVWKTPSKFYRLLEYLKDGIL